MKLHYTLIEHVHDELDIGPNGQTVGRYIDHLIREHLEHGRTIGEINLKFDEQEEMLPKDGARATKAPKTVG